MTNTELAIQKAVEGGWDEKRAKVSALDMRDGYEGMTTSMKSTDKAFLDPLFWQALGKTEGWDVWGNEVESDIDLSDKNNEK